MPGLIELLQDRVLLADGATGSHFQQMDLQVERDYQGAENCTEILNQTQPDAVRSLHESYLAAGADILLTNSFGGSAVTLGEFGLAERAFDLNRRAGELACEAVEDFAGDGRTRFVLGSVGPGTKLPSLDQIGYDGLLAGLRVQADGLIAGGVDGVLIETVQDLLQLKAAVNAARDAMAAAGRELPIFCQVTVETTGTLLIGADIAAAATALKAMGIDNLGLNCATGPKEMAAHLEWLAQNWTGLISAMPNAGLPELVDGRTRYRLGPEEMTHWLERFVVEHGVNLIGGCCGTTAEHIAAFDAMLKRLGELRPTPLRRKAHWTPGIASLFQAVPYEQENAFLSIGERCNANGSKKFRERQATEDWDGCLAIAREQIAEASHALDLCTAFVGRDEVADMTALVTKVRGAVTAPLVIDSTELDVLEAALKLYGGKAIINSVHFEDGEGSAAARLALAKRYGAAVIALTIDEEGMAKAVAHKLEIARRLYAFAVEQHGLAPEDLLFDPLTFTICTGNADDRRLGLETLEAIELIAQELPACQIILGLSNISFGLKPAARHVLNSVYLDHALKRGMTGAILHLSKIRPSHAIPEEEVKVAEDLIYDRRRDGYDPLHAYLALFQDREEAAAPKVVIEEVEKRLTQRIIDGERSGLEADLDEALQSFSALDIINRFLLDGMKVVGELFGSGQMQLPFVLQSAETMKAAVRHLEPHMDRVEGNEKGVIVLATVKGDVHDIGKNLVDILLTNNGYKVVNLGIKQPIANIIEAAREHKADAIGLSSLLVKSAAIMRENLGILSAENFALPVVLGGAALTRRYVDSDCAPAYSTGNVAYARDAFDGLDLMAKVVDGNFDAHVVAERAKRPERPRKQGPARRPEASGEIVPFEPAQVANADVPQPPFFGSSVIDGIEAEELMALLNERMLYQFHWGYRKNGRRLDEYLDWAKSELRPILDDLMSKVRTEAILAPKAVYGFWPAASDGDDLVLYAPEDKAREVARFALPRQRRNGGLCIADFLRPLTSGTRDVIALQAVTVGQRASDVARQWFADDRYKDYLYLHGLSVEMAEAMAEFVHRRIRSELGFAADDAGETDAMLSQGYRGARYSFGYPACPNLADQRKLLSLLGAERVGLDLSEEDQLHPEQSTSALVIHHPDARYFTL